LRITARAGSASRIQESVDEVRQIMRGRHHLSYARKTIRRRNQRLVSFSVERHQLRIFRRHGRIASISLVVGGIVIMNIMLVSVTERTREIGVRKALGARRSDILLQFLIESATIAVIGGAIGVLCGIIAAKLVSIATPLPPPYSFGP